MDSLKKLRKTKNEFCWTCKNWTLIFFQGVHFLVFGNLQDKKMNCFKKWIFFSRIVFGIANLQDKKLTIFKKRLLENNLLLLLLLFSKSSFFGHWNHNWRSIRREGYGTNNQTWSNLKFFKNIGTKKKSHIFKRGIEIKSKLIPFKMLGIGIKRSH